MKVNISAMRIKLPIANVWLLEIKHIVKYIKKLLYL